jgi:hypothetical protein
MMFEYKEVEVILQSSYENGDYNNLLIDNKNFAYDVLRRAISSPGHELTVLQNFNGVTFILPMVLPLNTKNPKETIDRFFQLLVLS